MTTRPGDFPPPPALQETPALPNRTAEPWLSCPDCGALIALTLACRRVRVIPRDGEGMPVESRDGTPRESTTGPPLAPRDAACFTAQEQQAVDAAVRSGLLGPFTEAVTATHPDQTPKSMERFLLHFLTAMVPRHLPHSLQGRFRALFPGQELTYWTALGIVCVVVNGAIRLFVPKETLVPTTLKPLTGGLPYEGALVPKIDDREEKLDAWIRTRWGYVAGPGAALEALWSPSLGGFATPLVPPPRGHRT